MSMVYKYSLPVSIAVKPVASASENDHVVSILSSLPSVAVPVSVPTCVPLFSEDSSVTETVYVTEEMVVAFEVAMPEKVSAFVFVYPRSAMFAVFVVLLYESQRNE